MILLLVRGLGMTATCHRLSLVLDSLAVQPLVVYYVDR